MNNLSIETATVNDFDGVIKVIKNHYAGSNILFNPATPGNPNDIIETDRSITFVAKKDHQVIAFLALHSNKPFSSESNVAEFEVVVDPNNRKSEMGKKLLNHAIQYARYQTNLNALIAKIKNGNIPSEKLCIGCGFTLEYQGELGSDWKLNIYR